MVRPGKKAMPNTPQTCSNMLKHAQYFSVDFDMLANRPVTIPLQIGTGVQFAINLVAASPCRCCARGLFDG